LEVKGAVKSDDFHRLLEKDTFSTVEEGFRVALPAGEKYFPKSSPPELSLVTLKVKASQTHIHPGLRPGSLRMHFYDLSGRSFKNIPVTDLRFHSLAQQHSENEFYVTLNQELFSKEEVFLRLGLTRCYMNDLSKEGFWLQINGVYTFPEKLSTLPRDPFSNLA